MCLKEMITAQRISTRALQTIYDEINHIAQHHDTRNMLLLIDFFPFHHATNLFYRQSPLPNRHSVVTEAVASQYGAEFPQNLCEHAAAISQPSGSFTGHRLRTINAPNMADCTPGRRGLKRNRAAKPGKIHRFWPPSAHAAHSVTSSINWRSNVPAKM